MAPAIADPPRPAATKAVASTNVGVDLHATVAAAARAAKVRTLPLSGGCTLDTQRLTIKSYRQVQCWVALSSLMRTSLIPVRPAVAFPCLVAHPPPPSSAHHAHHQYVARR